MRETEHLVRFEHDDLEVLVLELELEEPDLPELTPSEREVALRVADGLSHAEIAAARGVALRTIANQVRSIFQKLGVCSRWDLALLLTRRALEAAPRSTAPEVLTARRSTAARARTAIVNSPATVGVLRTAYARSGADLDEALTRLEVSLLGDGGLAREDYCALFEELAATTEQPGLGLELARDLPVGAIGLLEWIALTAPTLGAALTAISQYGELLHPGARRVTRTDGDTLVVAYSVDAARPPRVIVDWSFGCLYERLRATAGAALEPIEVRVQYDDPGDGRAEDFFGCDVRFGALANEIVLPRDLGDLPMGGADRGMFELLTGVAHRRIQQAKRPTLVSRALQAIARELDLGPAPRSVAAAQRLGVSAMALERGLASAGERFEDLVVAARIDRAVRAGEGTGAGPRDAADAIRRALGASLPRARRTRSEHQAR